MRRRYDVVRASSRLLLALTLLAGGVGCVRGPDVAAEGLALRRVVIYRNGVAYFERHGHIDAEQVVFRVRKERVGDFLATLAVIEAGGSSVRSASFPVEVDEGKADGEDADEPVDPRFEVLLKPPPPKSRDDKKKDTLENVKLTLDGREHDLVVGYVAETPVWRPSYRLVMGGGAGAARPAKAQLQAWGIVQNLSGEDWKGVRLSLVAGAPLAFQATLDQASIPQRPIVGDQGEVIASVPTSETTLVTASAPPPPPPPAVVPEAEAFAGDESPDDDGAVDKKVRGPGAMRLGEGSAGGSPARAARMKRPAMDMPSPSPTARYAQPQAMPKGMPAAPPRQEGPSGPRNVSALAAVAIEGGTTRYDLPFPVDVPDKSATMVLLLAKPVPGESIFLFAPDGGVPASSSHPFRVARFTNDTNGLLERGPIAVFENSAFLGQGMVDPLPPGATATVPFALERGLAVETTREENPEGARLAKIEGGALEIERDWVTHTKYAVRNGGDEAAKTLVKHPRLYGTRLHEPPKGTEDNVGTGSALVPIDVPRRGTAVLDVDERRVFRQQIDWLSQLADDAVKGYLKDPRADAAMARQLQQAWDLRGKLRPALDERDGLASEKQRLEQQSEELRQNLRAIEKNKTADTLRRDLTDRLAKASARLDEITKRVIVLEMQINEQQIRFRDLTNAIKLLSPLSPVLSPAKP